MKMLMTVIMILTVSFAFAGPKEKKVKREASAKLEAGLTKMKTACGNKKLDAKIDWAPWEKTYKISSKSDKLKTMGYIGSLVSSTFDDIASLCKKDKDYKEEITKLITLNFTGKPKYKEMYVQFTLKSETVLNIMLNGDGYGSDMNKKHLLKAWD